MDESVSPVTVPVYDDGAYISIVVLLLDPLSEDAINKKKYFEKTKSCNSILNTRNIILKLPNQ